MEVASCGSGEWCDKDSGTKNARVEDGLERIDGKGVEGGDSGHELMESSIALYMSSRPTMLAFISSSSSSVSRNAYGGCSGLFGVDVS